jgi:hypothetical protein
VIRETPVPLALMVLLAPQVLLVLTQPFLGLRVSKVKSDHKAQRVLPV